MKLKKIIKEFVGLISEIGFAFLFIGALYLISLL